MQLWETQGTHETLKQNQWNPLREALSAKHLSKLRSTQHSLWYGMGMGKWFACTRNVATCLQPFGEKSCSNGHSSRIWLASVSSNNILPEQPFCLIASYQRAASRSQAQRRFNFKRIMLRALAVKKQTLEHTSLYVLCILHVASIGKHRSSIEKRRMSIGKRRMLIGKRRSLIGTRRILIGKRWISIGQRRIVIGQRRIVIGTRTIFNKNT